MINSIAVWYVVLNHKSSFYLLNYPVAPICNYIYCFSLALAYLTCVFLFCYSLAMPIATTGLISKLTANQIPMPSVHLTMLAVIPLFPHAVTYFGASNNTSQT